MNINNTTTDRYDPLQFASPLYETFASCANFLQYTKPLTYDEWFVLDQDHKAAALYVQFFSQITLAWYKCKQIYASFYASEEDAVSTMFQYILKNIPLIESDGKKFTEAYMYKVAYNCLYCICHDIKRDKDRYELEMSNCICDDCGEVMIDLFDTVAELDSLNTEMLRDHLWSTVDKLPAKYQQVVAWLLGEPLGAGVGPVLKRQILKDLKFYLAPYTSLYEPKSYEFKTFADLMEHIDIISSATVILSDGTETVFFPRNIREYKDRRKNTRKAVSLFGPDKDYIFDTEAASDLTVTDVEVKHT